MSYLDTPRLSFVGRFHADVPTGNNELHNYAPDNPLDVLPPSDWNHDGSGQFRLLPSRVTSVTDPSGQLRTDGKREPLIGALVSSRPHEAEALSGQFGAARIVDLDPYQRRASTLYGLEICLDVADGAVVLHGRMQPASLRDFCSQRGAFRTTARGGFVMPMSAVFQSVLTDVSWNGDIEMSPTLAQLYERSPDQLSIRFVLDRLVIGDDPVDNLTGRILGAIGPRDPGEPAHFVAQRRLIWSTSPRHTEFWVAPCQLSGDRTQLVFDLATAIRENEQGESLHARLHAAILPAGDAEPPARPEVFATPLDTSMGQLERSGGIVSVPVTREQAGRIDQQRIGLLLQADDDQPVLAEPPSGKYVDVEERVYRLNPGQSARIRFRALQFGKPLANQRLGLQLVPDGDYQINVPETAFVTGEPGREMSAMTDGDGRAEIVLTVRSGTLPELPECRQHIDSQVYLWGDPAGWQSWGMVGLPKMIGIDSIDEPPPGNLTGAVAILVFNTHPPIERPQWRDVQPILARYAKLYPSMRNRIALDQEQEVREYAALIKQSLLLPISDARHMPVTRDLSAYQLDLLLRWLNS